VEHSKPGTWDLAAESFLKCAEMDEPFEEPINQRLIELAGIDTAYTVVDIATGIGDPALSVARRVGPAGHVIAIDQSRAMLAIAEKRAHERGLTNIQFRQLDANGYDFPPAAVDAVVCRWGLMFLADLTDVFGRIRRSLKSRRYLAAATWSAADKVPIISLRRSVMRAFDVPRSPNDPFRLSSAAALEAAAAAAGFDQVAVTPVVVPYEYPSIDAFVDAQRLAHESRLAPLLPEPGRQAAFWRALGEAARPHAGTDGIVRLASEVLLLAARNA
jgi:SAM-dependent methyltransferase